MKNQVFVLILLMFYASELNATEAYRMGYQCQVTIVDIAGKVLPNTQLIIKINSEMDTLTTDVDGKINLFVDASYECPSNKSFFQRMFNRRHWSPNQFDLYHNDQYIRFKSNWRRDFRKTQTVSYTLNIDTGKIKRMK